VVVAELGDLGGAIGAAMQVDEADYAGVIDSSR
jgi:hypothetical protein